VTFFANANSRVESFKFEVVKQPVILVSYVQSDLCHIFRPNRYVYPGLLFLGRTDFHRESRRRSV
jgi:hypothetical protein